MSVKSDIEIAQAANLLPIQEIGAKLGIPVDALIPYGHDKAKISADFIHSEHIEILAQLLEDIECFQCVLREKSEETKHRDPLFCCLPARSAA